MLDWWDVQQTVILWQQLDLPLRVYSCGWHANRHFAGETSFHTLRFPKKCRHLASEVPLFSQWPISTIGAHFTNKLHLGMKTEILCRIFLIWKWKSQSLNKLSSWCYPASDFHEKNIFKVGFLTFSSLSLCTLFQHLKSDLVAFSSHKKYSPKQLF